jgi:hypothetical protein
MAASHPSTPHASADPDARAFYCDALRVLCRAGRPFLVGGAFAFAHYTGIHRDTKDLDVFVHPRDAAHMLRALAAAGYATEVPFPHWLGKAHCGDRFVDLIYGAGNGVSRVDDEWFEHAPEGEILGVPVKLCPPEETLWSKGFIVERERCDAADVAHLLLACADTLDWHRLLRRFGPHWRVLLAHLSLFGFIYPSERARIPAWVMETLTDRLRAELHEPPSSETVCQGTLLSREQYLVDVERWGYPDARVTQGHMRPEHVAIWTQAIASED